jgi:hypothetical protein
MKGNFQVRFLGEAVAAMPLPYPTCREGWSLAGRSWPRLPHSTETIEESLARMFHPAVFSWIARSI